LVTPFPVGGISILNTLKLTLYPLYKGAYGRLLKDHGLIHPIYEEYLCSFFRESNFVKKEDQ
jgi:hypothetical protein